MTGTEKIPDVKCYLLDKRASSFTVRVFPDGLLASFGHSPTFAIRDFSGDACISQEHPEQSSLTIRIRSDSLEVMDDIKSSDRREIEDTMRSTVLETAKHPEITFDSKRVVLHPIGEGRFRADMVGDLSMHGRTETVSVPAQVTIGGGDLRASGEFTLAQSRFGIKPVRVAGGALKLKDELKFRFDIVARARDQ